MTERAQGAVAVGEALAEYIEHCVWRAMYDPQGSPSRDERAALERLQAALGAVLGATPPQAPEGRGEVGHA